MKVAVMRFSSPDGVYLLDGETETKSSGLNYLKYHDEQKNEREFIINDDVKPVILCERDFFGREGRTPLYIMARDNFLSPNPSPTSFSDEMPLGEKSVAVALLTKDLFNVTGTITNEQLQKIADWGMVEALIRATKSTDMFKGWLKTVVILLVIAGVLAGTYILLHWLTGFSLNLPFLG